MQINTKVLRIVIFIATVPNKFTSRPRLLGSPNYMLSAQLWRPLATIFSITEVKARSIKLDVCSVIRIGCCTSWFTGTN